MDFCRQGIYDKWSDRELATAVTAVPHNEEAGIYLLCVRYSPLLISIYRDFHFDWGWYDDCVSELLMYIRGTDGNWHYLAGFEWRSTFGTWFRHVAYTQFPKIYFKLIESGADVISLDDESGDTLSIVDTIPDADDGITGELSMRKVLMMEAIMQMKDEDDKFIILKYLKGYSGEENAEMLRERWRRTGVVRYKNGNRVIPSRSYINVQVDRIKKALRATVNEMLKE